MLSRARVAVARGELEAAARILERLLGAPDLWVELQAKVQLGYVYDGRGDPAAAAAILDEVERVLAVKRAAHREGEAGDGPSRGAERSALPVFGLELELARAWTTVARPEQARSVYTELLRDRYAHAPRSEEMTHVVALAEYRLAEMRVEEDPSEAYRRWLRVLGLRDERVTPYAALSMASKIGTPYMVAERVEYLFGQAMDAGDPWLFSEAMLGLARHLRSQRQFARARHYYGRVAEQGVPEALVEEAMAEIETLGRAERMVSNRAKLRSPQRLLAKVQNARLRSKREDHEGKWVLVIGAGEGGRHLLESLDRGKYAVCGFIDDVAPEAPGHRVLGRFDDLDAMIREHRPDEVLLAIPTLSGVKRREIVKTCEGTSTPLRHLPAIHDLGIGWTREETWSRLRAQLRPVKVAELISEEPVLLDSLATGWLRDKPVVVIGAGAFGAEICRRLADGGVGRLVVVDRNESALRKVKRELWNTRSFWACETRAGDGADRDFLAGVFRACEPRAVFNTSGDFSTQALDPEDLVFDSERWKFVIDNEVAVAEAAAWAARDAGVPRMVHVSSNRARGRPVNDPFGAMKALCEQVVLRYARRRGPSETVQAVVRIGSLLDSRNGRLTGMEKQIHDGGRVELPKSDGGVHFISTARWAERVLRATALAANGDLLELDGGTPITPRTVLEYALWLEDLGPEDVDIEETADEWGDPPSTEKRTPRGDEELRAFSVDRPEPGDWELQAAVMTCARALERNVGGGGEPALIEDQLAGLVGLPEAAGVRVS